MFNLVIWAEIASLFILSLFGAHRLLMVVRYFLYRKAKPQCRNQFKRLPKVTVQIPIYNEWAIAQRVIEQVAKLDYPRECLEIQVLDDSTITACRAIAARAVAQLQEQGVCASHIVRDHRDGFKAGALAAGVECCIGEFVAVFDADFLPESNFLHETIHYFADSGIDLVQCRWAHLNADTSLITRAQAALLDGHFQIEHTVRNRLGHFFNFNGTAGIWRKSAIKNAGGWQGDTLTEDLDLSYRAQLAGSKFVYLLDYEVPAELPCSLNAFKSQQHRWTKGATEVFAKLAPEIIKSEISFRTKAEAFFHLAANYCYPLLLLAGVLLLPTMFAFANLEQGEFSYSGLQYLRAARLLFLLGFCSVLIFYFSALLESRRQSVFRSLQDVILAIVAGIGLSLSNSLAVIEGIAGRKTPFVRTPKTGELSLAHQNNNSQQSTIRRTNWRMRLTLIEFLLAIYFSFTIGAALRCGYYEAIPFSSLFFFAFSWFSYLGFRQLSANFRVQNQRRCQAKAQARNERKTQRRLALSS